MKKQIENRIKELYGKKGEFCNVAGLEFKHLSLTIKSIESKFNAVNRFLGLLKLKLIVEEPVFTNSIGEAFYISEMDGIIYYYDYGMDKIGHCTLGDMGSKECCRGDSDLFSEIFKSRKSLEKTLEI